MYRALSTPICIIVHSCVDILTHPSWIGVFSKNERSAYGHTKKSPSNLSPESDKATPKYLEVVLWIFVLQTILSALASSAD